MKLVLVPAGLRNTSKTRSDPALLTPATPGSSQS